MFVLLLYLLGLQHLELEKLRIMWQKKKEKQGFKQFINLLKTNKPLRIVLLSMLVLELSGAIKNTISIYYVNYNFNAEMMIQ